MVWLLVPSTSTSIALALHFSLHSPTSHLPPPLILLQLLMGSPSEIQEFSLLSSSLCGLMINLSITIFIIANTRPVLLAPLRQTTNGQRDCENSSNTGGLVPNLPHPRANKTKEHSHQNQRTNENPLSVFNKNSVLNVTSASRDTHYQFSIKTRDPTLKRGKAAGEPQE